MITPTAPLNYYRVFTVALLLAFVGSSCTSLLPISFIKPVIQTVQVTQLATILVTQEVTQQVTHVIKVPVIVTPSDTPLYTFIPTLSPNITSSPTLIPTPEPPVVKVLEHSDCLYGPGSVYLYKYSVLATNLMEVIGRNMDGSWLYIQVVYGWNPCWIQATLVQVISGDINRVPIVYSRLPYSNQYQPPDASAHREESEVTISWKAVWMSLDDYRGYLIEAWVCLNGKQTFVPISYIPPLASNAGTLFIKVTDEPDCALSSSARIYSSEKQGYSDWSNIPWPAYQATLTPGNG
jgi:hypothetical protein